MTYSSSTASFYLYNLDQIHCTQTTDTMYKIISVLGAPGAGKTTICARLANKHPNQFRHISLGDLLRAEASNPESKWGCVLNLNLKEGWVGSAMLTVSLVQDALKKASAVGSDERRVFLVDGEPGTIGSRFC
jgi:UMP-CMP kinase